MLQAETISEQLRNVIEQRDQAQQTFHQCVGAIALLSEQLNMCTQQQMIKEADEQKDEPCKGESVDEQVNDESQEQAA